MNRFSKPLAALLICATLTGFLAAPRSAQALIVFDPTDFPYDTASLIQNTISAVANLDLKVKEYFLDFIAWNISNKIARSITGSVVKFVNGSSIDGSGNTQTQYITDLLKDLQGQGDNQAAAFISAFSAQSDSPFAPAITSSLRRYYAEGSTLQGFFSSKQCTLYDVSSDVDAFIAGDFSKGGWPAWIELINERNNPYMVYEDAKRKLVSVVDNAKGARLANASWGRGFVGWCDSDDSSGSSWGNPNAPATGGNAPGNALISQDAQDGVSANNASLGSRLSSGINGAVNDIASSFLPQRCLNRDGTAQKMRTPGAVIQEQLAKALAQPLDRITMADELNEVVGEIAGGFIERTLGGPLGGLLGLTARDALTGGSYINDVYLKSDASQSRELDIYNSAAGLPAASQSVFDIDTSAGFNFNSSSGGAGAQPRPRPEAAPSQVTPSSSGPGGGMDEPLISI